MNLLSSCLMLSLRNLAAHKVRSVAAGAGIAFALFLIFLQWGFLQAAKKQTTLLYEYFDYELVMVADTYQFMFTAQPFDRIRLVQAQALPSVDDTFSLNFAVGGWEDKASSLRSSLLLLGLDSKPDFILNPQIREGLKALDGSRKVMVDAYSHADFGPLEPGTRALVNDQEVEVASHFTLGLFFYTEGSALVDNTGFLRLSGRRSRHTSFGLIRLIHGVDPKVEREKLQRLLPGDVIVMTKGELIDAERSYFVKVKPLGIVFKTGLFIAFVTGAVILFQVIFTDIRTRMKEYATLKAMGFGPALIYGSAVAQTLIVALGAFALATVLSTWLFGKVFALTHLPVAMNAELFNLVLLLTLGMCLVIGAATLNKLSRTHPADLF